MKQQKHAALAVALAAAGLMHSAAQAQTAGSAVTIYGIIDTAFIYERGGPDGNVSKLTSGIGAGSRLGFRGTEDLGGGMQAYFTLENGFTNDNGAAAQGGLLFGRQAFVGLKTKAGSVAFGRQYTPQFLVLNWIDPFATALTGTTTNIMATTGTRMNNTVKYSTPTFGPVSGEVAYGFGEVAGDSAASRQVGGAVRYAQGPVEVRLGMNRTNNAANTDHLRNWLLGATYDFKIAKLHLAHGANEGSSTVAAPIDQTDTLIGLTYPINAQNTILFSHIIKNDKLAADQDASQSSLGYYHWLSKRTALYGSYTFTSTDNGAPYRARNATDVSGTGNRAIAVGLHHRF